MGKIMATTGQVADFLVEGYWRSDYERSRQWSKATVSYSFGDGWSATEQVAATRALQSWSDVAGIAFTRTGAGGDIAFAKGRDGRAWSDSNYDGYTGNLISSKVSIDTQVPGWDNLSKMGGYGYMTLVHEIGHAIGLGHAGAYNYAGEGDTSSYERDAVFDKDSNQYTLMSYWSARSTGANHGGYEASTPLVCDILAAQKIYGVNTATRAGNTTYGFHADAGTALFDFTVNARPVVAIWDGGGTDILDLSGYAMAVRVDLRPGAFSDVGGLTKNLAIAEGATLENVIGGRGSDKLAGNDVDNTLTGGRGNDTLTGGAGADTAIFTGDLAEYDLSLAGDVAKVTDRVSGRDGVDTLSGIEYLQFRDQRITPVSRLGNQAPRVAVQGQTVKAGQALAASSLFTVNDVDGDAITLYQFQDPKGGGSIRLNGATNMASRAQAAAGVFRVAAEDLDKVEYVGAVKAGRENVKIWANDGRGWGSATVAVTSTGNRAPKVVGRPATVESGAAVAISSLFTVDDVDGDAITLYQFQDPKGGGSIRLNGATNMASRAQTASGVFRVAAENLDKVEYLGVEYLGAAGSTRETLRIWANDGRTWGEATARITTAKPAGTSARAAGELPWLLTTAREPTAVLATL